VDVATRVYLDDFHDIAVPPCKNTKPVHHVKIQSLSEIWHYGDQIDSQHMYIQLLLYLDQIDKINQDLVYLRDI
jgi:hypothetical protein